MDFLIDLLLNCLVYGKKKSITNYVLTILLFIGTIVFLFLFVYLENVLYVVLSFLGMVVLGIIGAFNRGQND